MPHDKVDLAQQGRELVAELDIPRVPLISRPPVPIATRPDRPAIKVAEPAAPEKILGGSRSLDHLTEERETLVALNVRVPAWVSSALEKMVYETKASGKKIRKEVVVSEAIIDYLGLTRPEGVQ
jgi:hypothetical protein